MSATDAIKRLIRSPMTIAGVSDADLRDALAAVEWAEKKRAEIEDTPTPVARTDRQIVEQTEELATYLLSWGFNHEPENEEPLRDSEHPFAKRCWAAACHIQEMLTATDPENAVAELDGAPPPAPVAHNEPVARIDSRPVQMPDGLFRAEVTLTRYLTPFTDLFAAAPAPVAQGEPVAWVNEDELPNGYPYDLLFQHSKVEGVRLFPIFGPPAAAHVTTRLTDEEIEAGRHEVFSTSNPFCPCDSKTMLKAVRWAERAIAKRAAPAPVAQPLTAAQITAEAQGRYSNNASAQAFAAGALWAALRVTGGAA